MDTVIEFVVSGLYKETEFYTKYLGFKEEFTEYDPPSWLQLRNGNTIIYNACYL